MTSLMELMEILNRAHDGEACPLWEWDAKRVPTVASAKVKEHGLNGSCDEKNPINTDNGLADGFFKAGYELALELGFLCVDTERIVRVTEDELKEAIRRAPSEMVVGLGRDATTLQARIPEDGRRPKLAAPLGIAVSEDLWVPLMAGIAQQKEVEIFQGGSMITIFGREVMSGTPYETLVGGIEAQRHEQAMWIAGRPGLGTTAVISSVTVFGQLGGYGVPGGYDPKRDLALVLSPAELKTTYTSLHKIVHALICGGRIIAASPSMLGGYAGGPEATSIVIIAGALLEVAIHKSGIADWSLMDLRYNGNAGRQAQWGVSIATQALSRNTDLITSTLINQTAGPCTDMLLFESAVGMTNVSSSGISMVKAPRSARGRLTDHLTPLECRFCGEVLHAAAGIKRADANEIAKKLIPKYEEKLRDPPTGKSFKECYDVNSLKPSAEWLDIYKNVKKELIDLGIPLEP